MPRAGDLIFFGNYKNGEYYKKSVSDSFTSRVTKTDACGCSHIGFVKSVAKQADGTYHIVTIEGNYSKGVYEVDKYYNSNGEQLNDQGKVSFERAITYFAVPKYSE